MYIYMYMKENISTSCTSFSSRTNFSSFYNIFLFLENRERLFTGHLFDGYCPSPPKVHPETTLSLYLYLHFCQTNP